MSDIKTRNKVSIKCIDSMMTDILQDALNSSNVVELESGVYFTGPLEIRSNTTLIIKEGSVLRFSDKFELYSPVFSRWEGVKCWCMHPLLFINNAENVKVSGNGTIDGSGKAWWDEVKKRKKDKTLYPINSIEKRFANLNPDYLNQPSGGGGRSSQFLRPPLIQIKSSSNVVIEKLNIINSPFWTVHPLFSTNVKLDSLIIKNPSDAPNTDGLDIESSSSVEVINTTVDVGDDGIALKSGSGEDGVKDSIPTKDILIKDSLVKNAHGGAVIGSETAGGVEGLVVDSCIFDGTERGVRIKTRRGRGGSIKNLVFKNIKMINNLCPFVINMFYRCGSNNKCDFSQYKLPILDTTPEISNVVLENIVALECKSSAGVILGLPERPIKSISIENSVFALSKTNLESISSSAMYDGLTPPASRGLWLKNAEVKVKDLEIEVDDEKIIKDEGVLIE